LKQPATNLLLTRDNRSGLDELDFHFNIIGVTETKISNLNQPVCYPHIPGYIFEHAPTPLASGGAGMFIDKTLNSFSSGDKFHIFHSNASDINISTSIYPPLKRKPPLKSS
jgi:hypothetical protein